MITEQGVLPVGIDDLNGVTHSDFEVRPRLVRDSVEVLDGPDGERASKSDRYFGVCLIARQIVRIGMITEITPEMVLDLVEDDFNVIQAASEALATRLKSFRCAPPSIAVRAAGSVENGAAVSGGAGNAGSGS